MLSAFILYEVKIFSKSKYYTLRRLRRAGVHTEGREIYVTRDCRISAGVTLCSPCHISGAAVIGEGVKLLPGCIVDGAVIDKNCTLGPFCNVRAGTQLGENCRVGDFVELKNSFLGRGCKAAHLAYIGDADVGEEVNIGCGVVFANYDGRRKSRSFVGDRAFIGCNSNIIAPANIGRGAYIAAGTQVCGDIPADSLAVGRPTLAIKQNGASGRYLNV